MNEKKIAPLIFGGDINVYSVARAFHEAYGVSSTAYGKFKGGPCADTAILDYRICAQNEEGPALLKNVTAFAAEHPDETVIVFGCGDKYVELISENKDKFPKNCLTPYIDFDMLEQLINKEEFYKLCEKYGIDHPATFIHRAEMGHDFELPFEGPFICKPASSARYWEYPFPGNDKVFKLATREELEATLDKVYAAGYPESMIIQEFIPGDDSYMRVLTNYSDRSGKVKLMCLGHVLLEEHTPHGLGNHAVILTETNDALCGKLKAFLEDIGYTGFSNFDIKYDRRDGKYKVFEINCRQGRSNYYVTGCGQNVARWVVDDLIEEKELPFVNHCPPALWTVVPMDVAYKFTPKVYHPMMKQLVKEGKVTNSMQYAGDKGSLKKTLRGIKSAMRYRKNFNKYYQVPPED